MSNLIKHISIKLVEFVVFVILFIALLTANTLLKASWQPYIIFISFFFFLIIWIKIISKYFTSKLEQFPLTEKEQHINLYCVGITLLIICLYFLYEKQYLFSMTSAGLILYAAYKYKKDKEVTNG